MWVRNQNKDALKEIKTLLIDEVNDGYAVVTPFDINDAMILGEYSTEERAIEVLDEIQDRINEGCPFVYQMPEDKINNDEEEI